MMVKINRPWHTLKPDEIFKSLWMSPDGLTQTEASERLRSFGANRITEAEKVSAFKILWGELKSFFNIILLFSFVRIMIVRQMDNLSIWSNKWLLVAMAAGISLQLMVIYTPFLRDFFNILPLGFVHWIILIPIVVFSAFVGVFGARMIMKYVPAI